MNYFLYKLTSPRVPQGRDTVPSEADIFASHAEFWREQVENGKAVAFGPVADPNGSYTIAILRLDPEVDPSTIVAGDPALISLAGFTYEVHPMPGAFVGD
ncbi:MAG TPA: hypothetical protein PKD24_02850 [Pyrinomonadaceae bacterium]|nr:hypothetical protein [Pyrinomonadaceae bacterium]HMP64490.1 hypothetical protein [Pyrinomonadaceae bacterium]